MIPKVAVILLNWNGLQDTCACLKSLDQVDYPNFEIIVCDNGSTDGSISYLRRKFPDITLIENGENLGFAEGNNRGIQFAIAKGFDYIFLLNNDTIVDKNILTELIAVSDQKTIVGPKLYLYDDPCRFDHLGGKWNPSKGIFTLIGNREEDDHRRYESSPDLDYVCGAALFAPKEAYRRIGLLEPRFFLFWEESDWCLRAKKAGFRILLAPKAKVWHKVSASFTGKRPHTTYFWWRNRLLFLERNLCKKELRDLYRKVICPEVFRIVKLRQLKGIQLFLRKKFRPLEDQSKRLEKLLCYRAALCGVRDYLLRRFGNGPSWLFKK